MKNEERNSQLLVEIVEEDVEEDPLSVKHESFGLIEKSLKNQ